MVLAQEMRFDVADRVATITFDRPDKVNAWTPGMEAELRRLLDIAAKDDEVRAIVITGAGKGFCAGADMGRLSSTAAGKPPAAQPVPESDEDLGQRVGYLLS